MTLNSFINKYQGRLVRDIPKFTEDMEGMFEQEANWFGIKLTDFVRTEFMIYGTFTCERQNVSFRFRLPKSGMLQDMRSRRAFIYSLCETMVPPTRNREPEYITSIDDIISRAYRLMVKEAFKNE